MNALLPVLMITLALSAIFGLAMQHRFLSILRTRHPSVWEGLGKPTLFVNNSISNSFSVIGYLFRQKYLSLDDPRSIRLASFLRNYLIAYFCLFLVTMITFFMTQGPRRELRQQQKDELRETHPNEDQIRGIR